MAKDIKFRKDGQKKIVLPGQIIRGWEVLQETTFEHKYPSNLCKCLGCGTEKLVRATALTTGQSSQCRSCANLQNCVPVVVPTTKQVFPSIKAAAQALAIDRSTIRKAIRQKKGYAAGLTLAKGTPKQSLLHHLAKVGPMPVARARLMFGDAVDWAIDLHQVELLGAGIMSISRRKAG
jgi:hypothetical protein